MNQPESIKPRRAVPSQRPSTRPRPATQANSRPRHRPVSSRAGRYFPRLGRARPCYGVATLLAVAEARGRRCRLTVWRLEKFFQRPGRQPRQRLLASVGEPEAGRLFAALGHPHRLAILKAILTGADSYQQLRDRVGLKAGPLYHHVRELRLAGLLELGGRDSYHLSQLGQDVVLLACSLARMVSKRTASAQ